MLSLQFKINNNQIILSVCFLLVFVTSGYAQNIVNDNKGKSIEELIEIEKAKPVKQDEFIDCPRISPTDRIYNICNVKMFDADNQQLFTGPKLKRGDSYKITWDGGIDKKLNFSLSCFYFKDNKDSPFIIKKIKAEDIGSNRKQMIFQIPKDFPKCTSVQISLWSEFQDFFPYHSISMDSNIEKNDLAPNRFELTDFESTDAPHLCKQWRFENSLCKRDYIGDVGVCYKQKSKVKNLKCEVNFSKKETRPYLSVNKKEFKLGENIEIKTNIGNDKNRFFINLSRGKYENINCEANGVYCKKSFLLNKSFDKKGTYHLRLLDRGLCISSGMNLDMSCLPDRFMEIASTTIFIDSQMSDRLPLDISRVEIDQTVNYSSSNQALLFNIYDNKNLLQPYQNSKKYFYYSEVVGSENPIGKNKSEEYYVSKNSDYMRDIPQLHYSGVQKLIFNFFDEFGNRKIIPYSYFNDRISGVCPSQIFKEDRVKLFSTVNNNKNYVLIPLILSESERNQDCNTKWGLVKVFKFCSNEKSQVCAFKNDKVSTYRNMCFAVSSGAEFVLNGSCHSNEVNFHSNSNNYVFD